MRRSLAPSQKGRITTVPPEGTASTKKGKDSEDEITIQRMPMFGFLEVPESMNKQFKVPSGCVITEKTLELRKQKRLGNSNRFQVIRPGDLARGVFRVSANFQNQGMDGEDDADEEQMPTSTNLPPFEPLVLWSDPENAEHKIEVIPELACRLRPHQREGVQFLFECTMGMRGFDGQGCILADDMGLGKTLMSITALWTLLNQGIVKGESAVRKVMVVCPTSLVGNWDNELRKWIGDHCPTFAVKQDPKKVIKSFLMHRGKGVLIVSYETQRLYFKLFEEAAKKASILSSSSTTQTSYSPVCDLIICDEAHKLKNAESELSKCLNALPARKRILLSGTPMQNELTEFFNMVNFCNPGVLGSLSEFRRRYERPILASREPDALPAEINEAGRLQKELSVIVNEFILKRGNILNAQHLPPKLVQFVCCRLTPLQEAMYQRLLSSKEIRHIREGKQTNTLNSIRQLINICSHPQLILDQYQRKLANREEIDDDLAAMVEMIPKSGIMSLPPAASSAGNRSSSNNSSLSRMDQLKNRSNTNSNSSNSFIDPEQSGKMAVLFRMMQAMRAVQRGERIVVVSNYTSTLDLIETMCQQQKWPVLRLDGTVTATKRTKLVEEFNNPHSQSFAFLLSSKAGGCGINLIGGNRLVLFDPDWNPASDKQAAGRIWREGQKRRCFIYRFMSSGSIEEKIIQRQLSKEGLADIVDDKEQINQFSSDELRQLFTLLKDTRSDTHDTLMCPRCNFVKQKRYITNSDGTTSTNPAINKGPKMTSEQMNVCLTFLQDFSTFLQQESVAYQRREATRLQAALTSDPHNQQLQALVQKATKCVYETLPFQDRLNTLRKKIEDQDFDNLTAYSRRQREIFQEIDNDLKGDLNDIYEAEDAENHPANPDDNNQDPLASNSSSTNNSSQMLHYFPASFSVYAQFLRQWTDLVPGLMALSTAHTATTTGTNSNNNGTTDEGIPITNSVEQEGCPEETDMNKWSHHCSPLTCDDELFAKALGDDDALVSFVFGLEVNWSLLEIREAETKDEKERRKLQQIQDLEELNAKRRAIKEKKEQKESASDGEGEEHEEQDNANEKQRDDTIGAKKTKKERKTKEDDSDNDENNDDKLDRGTKKRPSSSSSVQSTKKAKTGETTNNTTSSSNGHKSNRKILKEETEDILDHDSDEIESSDEERHKKDKKKLSTKSAKSKVPETATTTNATSTKFSDNASNTKSNATKSRAKAAQNTSSAPVEGVYIPPDDADHFELDVFFENDRKKFYRLLQKQKFQIPTFDHFWKILKNENNDWRVMMTPQNIEIFTRTPGLKITELRKYKRNIEFFVDPVGLVQHFLLQCRLRDDDVLGDLFQTLLTSVLEANTCTNVAIPTSDASTTNTAKDSNTVNTTASKKSDQKNNDKSSSDAIEKMQVDNDEGEEEDENIVVKKSATKTNKHDKNNNAPKKRAIILSDDEDDTYFNTNSSTSNSNYKLLDAHNNNPAAIIEDIISHHNSNSQIDLSTPTKSKSSQNNAKHQQNVHRYSADDIICFDTPDDTENDENQHINKKTTTRNSGSKRKRDGKDSQDIDEESDVHNEDLPLSSAAKRKVQFEYQHNTSTNTATIVNKENQVNSSSSTATNTQSKKRSRTSPEQPDSLLLHSQSQSSAHKNNNNNTHKINAIKNNTYDNNSLDIVTANDSSSNSHSNIAPSPGDKLSVRFQLSSQASTTSSSDTNATPAEDDCNWTCDVCTFINENPVYRKKCQICKSKRFGSQRVAKRELVQLSQQIESSTLSSSRR